MLSLEPISPQVKELVIRSLEAIRGCLRLNTPNDTRSLCEPLTTTLGKYVDIEGGIAKMKELHQRSINSTGEAISFTSMQSQLIETIEKSTTPSIPISEGETIKEYLKRISLPIGIKLAMAAQKKDNTEPRMRECERLEKLSRDIDAWYTKAHQIIGSYTAKVLLDEVKTCDVERLESLLTIYSGQNEVDSRLGRENEPCNNANGRGGAIQGVCKQPEKVNEAAADGITASPDESHPGNGLGVDNGDNSGGNPGGSAKCEHRVQK